MNQQRRIDGAASKKRQCVGSFDKMWINFTSFQIMFSVGPENASSQVTKKPLTKYQHILLSPHFYANISTSFQSMVLIRIMQKKTDQNQNERKKKKKPFICV